MPLWNPYGGDGSYRNPVIFADYSDPDVVRVGADFYLVASSFHCLPGLPILHSRDLVGWTLIGHAVPRLPPGDFFDRPQLGKGVWAPALRHRQGRFVIHYPDPDHGIYAVAAADPAGPWSAPHLVVGGKGLIDPCPIWDEAGNGHLIHGWAKSRAGINNRLTLRRLSPDGLRSDDPGTVVIDGDRHPGCHTLEGPKLYRRDGYWYVFAPAGGVATGWQCVFRSRRIGGPYEMRTVLAQGGTAINGPHQGAWVDAPDGSDWFVHFQDRGPYGRVVHLQPMGWQDGWPTIGERVNAAGCGQPVAGHRLPVPGILPALPATSDEFASGAPGMQWQWQANPRSEWTPAGAPSGALRLACGHAAGNLSAYGALLLQKLPAPALTATVRLDFAAALAGERAGLVVFGDDYAWIGLRRGEGGFRLVFATCADAQRGTAETVRFEAPLPGPQATLRVDVAEGALCRFSFSAAGGAFTPVAAEPFAAKAGRWVGAKVGLFAESQPGGTRSGVADFGPFRVS